MSMSLPSKYRTTRANDTQPLQLATCHAVFLTGTNLGLQGRSTINATDMVL